MAFYGLPSPVLGQTRLKQKKVKKREERPSYAFPPKATAPPVPVSLPMTPEVGESIILLGNTLGERMQYYGFLETALHQSFPGKQIRFRNMCHPGDTAGFRPRAGRESQWAFPGAERFNEDLQTHLGKGHYPSPDQWLAELKADTIICFFGFNESFQGLDNISTFKAELNTFIEHSQSYAYNGVSPPRLILVSPIAFEKHEGVFDLPDGVVENRNLEAYMEVMRELAQEKKVGFVDLFHSTLALYEETPGNQTDNGCHLSKDGYRLLAPVLLEEIYGKSMPEMDADFVQLQAAVNDKSWLWFNDFRMLNGVHAYGQRWRPYGNVNYPEEIEKIRQMTVLRDKQIWKLVSGEVSEYTVDDSTTRTLTPIKSNYRNRIKYLDKERVYDSFDLPDGYEIKLFASEEDWPNLANPVQMSFDNRGRLWVSVLPGYPHYRPGGSRPNDKILIYEDTDGDHVADKEIVFADKLNLPIGFELAPEGVYVSQEPNLVLLKDKDGDDHADEIQIILGGFDTHDTHHAISAFCGDASGAIYMSEGRFLHSQVETPYGPQRCSDGGVWRFHPKTWRLERFSQSDYHNPWGIAVDHWGQTFISDASSGMNYWLLPLSVKVPHGKEIEKEGEFTTHRVRPTSGIEFIYSRHFPDEVQGDFLINNCIGFLGTKQHSIREDGAGYTGEHRQDLLQSNDPNFRPCDLEFAPDGSLYIVDWHNALIGHMQHSARDPKRDHSHGRIYRISYPARALVNPPTIAEASIETLLENLKLPEYRARYRTQRELRGRSAPAVISALKKWIAEIDKNGYLYEHHMLEALWVTWGHHLVDREILDMCLRSSKHQVRSAAVRVLRHSYRQVPDYENIFLKAANDEHPRVRLEAIVAASWLDNEVGARVALESLKHPISKYMRYSFMAAMAMLMPHAKKAVASNRIDLEDNPVAKDFLTGKLDFTPKEKVESVPLTNLSKKEIALFKLGKEVYKRDAHCATCHQADGKGLANIYPPLFKSEWVSGDEERLIKVVLRGLAGPIEVAGKKYDPSKGVPPMIGFAPLLNDREVAAVLTYIRKSFKNNASAISPETVSKIRQQTKDRKNFYQVDEILKEHPF